MQRISKENYYLNIAQTVLERATCLRRVYFLANRANVPLKRGQYNCALKIFQ